MPRAGGTYTPPTNSWSPAINGTLATTADWQALLNDIVAALTQSVSKDGQTTMTGSLNMGGFNLTNVAAASIASLSLFPNVAAPVSASNTELDYSVGVTSGIQSQIDGKQPADADLTAVAALSGTGLAVRTGGGTWANRSIIAGAGTTVTNGDGVAGDITIAVQTGIGTGDVIGPAGATSGNLPSFADASGKVLADSGFAPSDFGDVSGPVSSVDDRIATFDGLTGKIIQDGGQTIAEVITAAAAASGLVLLATATASGSSELTFTGIDGTYDEYVFSLVGLVPAVAATFNIQTSGNNGSSYDSGASDYKFAGSRVDSTPSAVTATGGASSSILFGGGITVNATASNGGMSGDVRLYNPASTTKAKLFVINTAHATAAALLQQTSITGQRNTTTAVNAVRFFFTGQNIATGSIHMYGVKK